MAPRPPEAREALIARLQKLADTPRVEVRFGAPHHSHAVCRDGQRWSVRRLELDPAEGQAFMREHGYFMPENAEDLSKPGAVVLEADTLAQLIELIERRPWPFA